MKLSEGQAMRSEITTETVSFEYGSRLVAEIVESLVDRFRRIPDRVWQRIAVAIQGLVVFAVGYGFHAHLARYGVDPHHDGIMFKPALDVSQGKMVFRDTFTQYGGVTVLLQAAALKVFGPQLLVLKLQTAVTYGLSFTVLWRAWSRIMPSILAALVCVVGSLLGPDSIASSLPWSSVFAIFFQAVALLCALRYLERGRDRELVYSGAAAALAFWCRQPVGVFLFGGMLVALGLIGLHLGPAYSKPATIFSLRTYLRQDRFGRVMSMSLLFGGGFIAVNAVILGWLTYYGALNDWWIQSIKFAAVFSRVTGSNTALAVLGCLFPAPVHLRAFLLLGAVVAIQAMRSTAQFMDPARSARTIEAAKVLLVSTVAVTSWLQYYPVACVYHCYWAAVPMFGVFAYLFYASHEASSRVVRTLVAGAVYCLIFYIDVETRLDSVAPHISSQNVEITGIPTLRGMRVDAVEAINYDALHTLIEEYLRVHPDGTIVTTTAQGLFPALSIRQASFHPMYMVWDLMENLYPEASAARARYIKEKLPMIIGPGAIPATHVYVGHITWGGVGNNILVPKDTRPTAILECSGAGVCNRRPIENPPG